MISKFGKGESYLPFLLDDYMCRVLKHYRLIYKKNLDSSIKPPIFSRPLLIYLILVYATLNAYVGVTSFDFINYDDRPYVTENSHVRNGLAGDNIRWALTATKESNWHPLTWISHMADVQLFGLNPAGHHFTNVVFHIINAILLLMVLMKMTGELWKSSFVAFLFALHPLHVESVVWIAERKDVLSTFFFLLTLLAYTGYCRKKSWKPYLLAVCFFICGLMSKPMLVTLPFVLLLLDYWPLQRYRNTSASGASLRVVPLFYRFFIEKIPFFILTICSCIITYIVQKNGGSVDSIPLLTRIENACLSYVTYIIKMVYPHGLAILYPFPQTISVWKAVAAAVFILAVTVWSVCNIRKKPWLAVGWFWYLGTLAPVIGFIQVGVQAMADRYTYIPLTGLFIMVAWEVPEMVRNWRYKAISLSISATGIIIALGITTWGQVQYWKNSQTIFEHALAVTSGNYVAHNNLGVSLLAQKKLDKAQEQFSEAIRINPGYFFPRYNLGLLYYYKDNMKKAIECYQQAMRMDPRYADVYFSLGQVYYAERKFDRAIAYYKTALKLSPDSVDARTMLHQALKRKYSIRH